MNGLKVSPAGLALIKRFESFSANPYRCPAGKLTIGYGHVISMMDRLIPPITVAQADALLAADLSWVEEDLNALPLPLTQGQFDALASLTYNIGRGAFAGSTLKKRLLAHDMSGAADQFPRWVRANGKMRLGLVNRRIEEMRMFRAAPPSDPGIHQPTEATP